MNLLETEAKARAAIELFYSNTKMTDSYDGLMKELIILNNYLQKYANIKSNRVNKVMTAFKMYFINEAEKKREINHIVKVSQVKRLSFMKSYKDYKNEFIILRKRGYSYAKIALYSKSHFKVKVSKDTVRNYIKEFE